nr:hypothetical protein [Mycolicibacterium austroafricanum]
MGIGDGDKRSGDLAEGKAHTVRGGSDLCESLIFGAAAQGHEDTDRNINASTGQEIWVQRRMHREGHLLWIGAGEARSGRSGCHCTLGSVLMEMVFNNDSGRCT